MAGVRYLTPFAPCGLLCTLLLACGQAMALDPWTVDILRLRLGMSEPEVMANLTAQGLRRDDFNRNCLSAVTPCTPVLSARTRDGMLTITFVPGRTETSEPMVGSVRYQVVGRLPGEREMIRTSVLDRFGAPNAWQPLTWCEPARGDGQCAPDRPRLSFSPGPGEGAVLLLSAGAVR